MAWALTRAAAAAALRRSSTGATPHRAAPLGPLLPRFGRILVTRCYRTSGPPEPEEAAHKGSEYLDAMDKEALLQFAKQAATDKEKLLKGQCQFNPVQEAINTRNLTNNLKDLTKRIEDIQKFSEKHRDITSIYVKHVGSFNLLAVGTGLFTVYQVWVHKL